MVAERTIARPRVPEQRDVAVRGTSARRAPCALLHGGWPARLTRRDLAGGFSWRRRLTPWRAAGAAEMLPVPQLGAHRVVLPHINLGEAAVFAGALEPFNRQALGAVGEGEAGLMRGHDALGFRFGERRLRQRAGERIAADVDVATLVGRVERLGLRCQGRGRGRRTHGRSPSATPDASTRFAVRGEPACPPC